MRQRSARDRFEAVREACDRLDDVQRSIMYECDDWRPPTVRARVGIPDPTARAAIYNVDELDGRLAALRQEESELIGVIGEALVIIRAVRAKLGDKYADVLEWRYIDRMSWDCIKDEHDVARRTARDREDIAFDWVDSIGMTRILAGDLEI